MKPTKKRKLGKYVNFKPKRSSRPYLPTIAFSLRDEILERTANDSQIYLGNSVAYAVFNLAYKKTAGRLGTTVFQLEIEMGNKLKQQFP